MRTNNPTLGGQQRGAALLLFALIGLILGLGLFFSLTPEVNRSTRDQLSADAMAQAKAALIGYALTYRDTHPNESWGYLPCPDTDNNGEAEGSCGDKDVSVIGRLPWKTLGLPALRDGSGECLWYAVSGVAKNSNPKTDIYNWDSPGQFVVQDADTSVTLAGATAHERPLAVIFAPGGVIAGQARTSAGSGECGGSTSATDYLEGAAISGTPLEISTLSTASANSRQNGSNNDQAVWINSAEIFGQIRKRTDFKADIDSLLADVATYLNGLPQASLPTATGDNKGVGSNSLPASLVAKYLATSMSPKKVALFTNWQDNLLYTKPGTASTVNGEAGCHAILLFGGERSATGQARSTRAERDAAGNYLEAPLATLFPAAGMYTAGTEYAYLSSSADLVRCIKGLAASQASFGGDFAAFSTAGASGAASPDAVNQTLTLQDASGNTGGCFWYGNPISLAGKTMRAYYSFKFEFADPPGGSDRGNGFTMQLVRGDFGIPIDCGSETDNGALPPLSGNGIWGSISLIIETDIRDHSSRSDPSGNHTAIMKNGSVDHGGFGAITGVACNGSSNLCEHSQSNKFEESPVPTSHNQRLEIFSGCNSTCTICNPASHVAPNTYAKVSVWSDCSNCSDVAINLDRTIQTPTIQICTALDPAMNQIYVGFTGGIASGGLQNRVTVREFVLRSE